MALYYQRWAADTGPSQKEALALLEVAYLTMCADRHLDDAERRVFARLSRELLAEVGSVDALVAGFIGAEEDAPARIEALAAELSPRARKAAYQVACVMAMADEDESDREFELDLTLISTLDLEQDEADELAAEARGA